MPSKLNKQCEKEHATVIFLSLHGLSEYNSLKISHLPAIVILFHFTEEQYFPVVVYHVFIIHLSVDGHLGWFHFLGILTTAAVNMDF